MKCQALYTGGYKYIFSYNKTILMLQQIAKLCFVLTFLCILIYFYDELNTVLFIVFTSYENG